MYRITLQLNVYRPGKGNRFPTEVKHVDSAGADELGDGTVPVKLRHLDLRQFVQLLLHNGQPGESVQIVRMLCA